MRTPRNDTAHVAERRCILSGETAPRVSLIRLALGPDGVVAPDVRAKAPGRGAWIGVDRSVLEVAQAKGKLKGALARAFKEPVDAPADLGERIEAALRQATLDRLGMEARGGTLLTGSEKIEVAARRGNVAMLLHAGDAEENGRRKLDQAWRVGSEDESLLGLILPVDRTALSMALGRSNAVHVALTDKGAANRVSELLDRWRNFTGCGNAPRPDGKPSESGPVVAATDTDLIEGTK